MFLVWLSDLKFLSERAAIIGGTSNPPHSRATGIGRTFDEGTPAQQRSGPPLLCGGAAEGCRHRDRAARPTHERDRRQHRRDPAPHHGRRPRPRSRAGAAGGSRRKAAVTAALTEVSDGTLLGGRVKLRQPVEGYRVAIDPVFLAAAVPAASGDRILDIGCGVGAASLCLAARVPECRVIGIERERELVRLAVDNALTNGMSARF